MNLEGVFQTVLETLVEGICICDPSGEILYSNPAAERMAGSLDEGKGCRILKNLCTGILKTAKSSRDPIHGREVDLLGKRIEYSLVTMQGHDLEARFIITFKGSHTSTGQENDGHHPAGDSIFGIDRQGQDDDLRERDRIMAGAALASNQLLISEEMDVALTQSLEILGCSANVDRAYIYEHYPDKGGGNLIRLRYEWISGNDGDHALVRIRQPDWVCRAYSFIPRWYQTLSGGMPIWGRTRDLLPLAREPLEMQGVTCPFRRSQRA